MPQVVKQNNRQTEAHTGNGVLGRVGPLQGSKVGRLKCSFYGNPKTGKTRLACTFPKPLLLIGAEDGTASVVGTKGVDFVLLEQTGELAELVEGPVRQGKYKSVVLDNVTKMREMRIVELFTALGTPMPERKPFLYADKIWKSVWTQCAQDMRDMLRPILDLPRVMPLNVVVIAQEAKLYQEDAGAAQSDLITPKVSSSLGDKLANWLNAECDYVCQTCLRQGTTDVVSEGGTVTKIPTGQVEYCLRVGPHETYITGFRQSIGSPALPDFIVDPTYEKIVKLIRGGQ